MKLYIHDMNSRSTEVIKQLEATRCPQKGECIEILDDSNGDKIIGIIEGVGTRYQHGIEEFHIDIRIYY